MRIQKGDFKVVITFLTSSMGALIAFLMRFPVSEALCVSWNS